MKGEPDIKLRMDMNIGINDFNPADMSDEQKEILENSGRNIKQKEKMDSTISGIANYRVIGGNQ